MFPFEFINGPWENSELPTIVRENPAGGDPHILAVLKRVHNPDALYELCRLANDAIKTGNPSANSLRDWFAATLPGELGHIDPEAKSELAGPAPYIGDFVTEGEWGIARIRWFAEFEAAWRYMRADAMLAAREKEGR